MARFTAMAPEILCLAFLIVAASLHAQAAPKNFIVILTDDQGYGDLSCFGSTKAKTPHIDQMAEEGLKMTSFYVASSVCTPSRAALLTGRMPKRVGLPEVLFPYSKDGLSPDEITIAELLKGKGYSTALIGKWHLGHTEPFLPTRQGFDSYFGIPYSNNMTIGVDLKISPEVVLNQNYTLEKLQSDIDRVTSLGQKKANELGSKVPLMRDNLVIEYPVDQSTITRRYTEKAVDFIHTNKDKPFFLYLAHSLPHAPLFVGDTFKGSSGNGLYYDIIQELDWSVGQVVQALKDNGLQEDTLIIFLSDNGPAGTTSSRGSAGPLRGRKFETFEGGQRVPAIAWAPGVIPAGSESAEILSALDVFPTIAHYAGLPVPDDRLYDGYDLSAHLEGRSKTSPREAMFFYAAGKTDIDGIRLGDWKYLINGHKSVKKQREEKLFDLREDVDESKNLFATFPEKVEALKNLMQEFDGTINPSTDDTR